VNKIRALVVDDEPLARERVLTLLQHETDVEVVGECSDGGQAVSAIQQHSPDLVFLDVQMPGCDGFEVIQNIGTERMPMVIFVTAYDQYALRAFEVHALDYLLKPFDEERLNEALDRAVKIVRGTRDYNEGRAPLTRLIVREPGRILFLDASDVDWIEAAENYVYLHAGAKKHLVRGTIKSFAERLDPARFARIHRSAIVNLSRVKELVPRSAHADYHVVLVDGTRLVASRSYADGVRRLCRRF
jgi:two-component system, LytTR family, response regulator